MSDSSFKAPTVALYQPGLVWYNQADRSTTPCPAIPIEITGNGVLTLLVFRKHSATMLTKQGVRHVDDPFLKTCIDAKIDCGGWGFAAGDNAFQSALESTVREATRSLRAEIDALRAQVEELQTAPEPKRGKKELANA